jgi:hypothetical protein
MTYRIDWSANTIEPASRLSDRVWDEILPRHQPVQLSGGRAHPDGGSD